MFESQLKQYDLQLNSVVTLCSDLTGDDLDREVIPGLNPGKWILGHLVLSAEFVMMLTDQPKCVDQMYHDLFMPGTKPLYEDPRFPTKQELLDELSRTHALVKDTLRGVNTEMLEQPQNTPFFKDQLPLKKDLISHLLTSHEMFHIGQLSAIRRAIGFPPLF